MIRLLEPDNQRRGDLFGRLMTDYFHALGYHDFLLNVGKSGREIDLRGQHRTESKQVLAECKATKAQTGGDDVNKFAGALDVEQARADAPAISGYVVSLNGFRSSALEQEREVTPARLCLVDGRKVEEELVTGHIVVDEATACAVTAKCLPPTSTLEIRTELDLLAHASGWYWSVMATQSAAPVAHALVHADGTVLGQDAAGPIIAADRAVGGSLHALGLITAEGAGAPSPEDRAEALDAYRAFLTREYGQITVDGLPAEEALGSRAIALEELFVPMHLQPARSRSHRSSNAEPRATETEESEESDPTTVEAAREPIGHVISNSKRITVLGPPGAGKSTLVRSLALAYGVPGHRERISDELPDEEWLPLVIRCRQLDHSSSRTIHEILTGISQQAELPPERADGMSAIVMDALRRGRALLLVDGLDEIAEPQARLGFVKQLRTFIGTYPDLHLISTSRDPGFRVVAGALRDVASTFLVAEFDDADIERLTMAWSVLVFGDSQKTRDDAIELAMNIVTTDRVRRLACNPLLLTTLLLVRRWLGDLPRKRTALYDKAIEVLLMTWNIEAHEPLDLDEAVPQLAYLAFAMTLSQQQVISGRRITELLTEARAEMPEVFGLSEVTPSQFLERVEERSSLLSLVGHDMDDGVLTALYEFKHLTFQEYLAAVAVTKNYYPGSTPDAGPLSVLQQHLGDEQWAEIVPLAAVLSGRRAGEIIEALMSVVGKRPRSDGQAASGAIALARCLADEVQISPSLVTRAAQTLAKDPESYDPELRREILAICSSKYRDGFRNALLDGFFSAKGEFSAYGGLLAEMEGHLQLFEHGVRKRNWASIIKGLLRSDSDQDVGLACLMVMSMAFETSIARLTANGTRRLTPGKSARLALEIRSALDSQSEATRFAAAWAYAWLGDPTLDKKVVGEVLPRLVECWEAARTQYQKTWFAWAISCFPLVSRGLRPLEGLKDIDTEFLRRELAARPNFRWDRFQAALIVGYYAGGPWDSDELHSLAMQVPDGILFRSALRDLKRM